MASFDTETGAMMVLVDGSMLDNVEYLCFSSRSNEYEKPYASLTSEVEKDGVEIYQSMRFSQGSAEPVVTDEVSAKADIEAYFNKN